MRESSSSTTPSRTAASSAPRTAPRRRVPPRRARSSAGPALRPGAARRACLRRQPGEATAEQLVEALRHVQRPDPAQASCSCGRTRDRARARRTDCPPSPPALGRAPAASARARAAPRASGAARRAERAEREPLSRSSGKERSSWNGARRLGRQPDVASTPIGSSRRRRSAIWSTPAEDGSSHCSVVEADENGPSLGQSACSTSSTASPIACASGASLRARRAAARPRALGGAAPASEAAISSSTGAAAPRGRRTTARPRPRRRGTSGRGRSAARPPRRPPPRGSSCRCPPRPRARARQDPARTRPGTPRSQPSSSSRPMTEAACMP